MTQVQQTTTITIDDTVYEVASMGANIQQMVQYLDDWRQREVDTTSELLMVRGALRDIQTTLLAAIQAEQAEVAAGDAAGDAAATTEAVDTPAEAAAE